MFSNINRSHILMGALAISIAGVLFSRTLISVGMILIIANAVIDKDIKNTFKKFIRAKDLVGITLIFFIYLFSGIYSENSDTLLDQLRIKLPFLLLPFSFCTVALSKKQFLGLLYFFVFLILMVALYVCYTYIFSFKEINESYRIAKVIPTPVNYVRFSLMVVFAFVVCCVLTLRKQFIYKEAERYLLISAALFFFIFIHVLAIRSGLLALYAAIVFLCLTVIFRYKKLWPALILILLFAFPFFALKHIPTLTNKWDYVRYDMEQFKKGENLSGYSDSRRILSIKGGIVTGMQKPLIGVGAGDIKDEMFKYYQNNFPDLEKPDYLLPHNQLVYVFAATGFIGVSLFMIFFLAPLFIYRKDTLLACFYIIILTSFLSEATIETQLGTAIFIIFLMLQLNYLKHNEQAISGNHHL